MLERVHVQGFKCLKDVAVDLGPFNVLIGRNDSGKSSFLQAVAEPARAWTRWGMSWDPTEVSASGWTVQLETQATALLFTSNHWNFARLGARSAGAPGGGDNFTSPETAARWLRQQRDYVVTAPISLDARQIAMNAPASIGAIDSFIETRGQGTGAHLAALALGDRERFDIVEAGLRETTKGRVKNIVVRDVGNSSYALHFRLFDGTVIPASQLSQGLLLFVGFLALIHRDPMPSTVLIEEPEAGLHPFRLFEVVDLLRSLTKRGTQVILTTHSPDLLSACKPEEVRVFYRPDMDSPTQVYKLPDDFERRAMREPLGQVWASRGEEGLLDFARNGIQPSVRAEPK